MITWLENPLNYSYLRHQKYTSTSTQFPVNTIEKQTQGLSRLVGYEMVEKQDSKIKGVYLYVFEFYWLKDHDRDLSPDNIYRGDPGFGGHMPTEAVNPVELVKKSPYQGE
jgi:hypothetical protein